MNNRYVYGAKLSVDGSMLFQPSTNGIDIFDGRVGNLRTRISFPIALSQNFDSLVSDGVDNILVAITGQTGSGIAVIDLTSISEPPPQSYFETSSIVDSGPLQISRPVLPVRRSSLEVGPDVPITVTQHRDGPAVLGKR
jgi:hypothetical protein